MANLAQIIKFPGPGRSRSLKYLPALSLAAIKVGQRTFISTPTNYTETAVQPKKQPCLLFSALCLQRPALIVPKKSPIEESFAAMMCKLEDENSKLSDHELRHSKDLEKAEKMRQGEEEPQDDDSYITAMDAEDAWETELTNFKGAQIEKDVSLSSAIRKLDHKLFFIGKQTLGEQSHWCFPQSQWQEGESLRETTEKIVKETFGDINVQYIGHAPVGVYKYSFMENGESVPVKIFFHRAEILETITRLSEMSSTLEQLWLTPDELKEYLLPRYSNYIQRFLLDL